MLLSDNISLLMNLKTTHNVKLPPLPIDPTYFPDLINHLNASSEWRKERQDFQKELQKPLKICKYRGYKRCWFYPLIGMKHIFTLHYIQSFLKDLETFKLGHPDLSDSEAIERISNEWRGYYNVYGEEFIRRTYLIIGNWANNFKRY